MSEAASRFTPHHSTSFKGIALFTPGGDVVYALDRQKQAHWHLNLCVALQEWLRLPEPPHFLVPGFTATIDRWQDANHQIHTIAEAAPRVLPFQALLNTIFLTDGLIWQPSTVSQSFSDPMVLLTYRQQFPQLWETHDLVMRYEPPRSRPPRELEIPKNLACPDRGYVLRLFVSGHSAATERTLQGLHQLLEASLNCPYTLKLIDVSQHPDLAEQDHVSATPTLMRVWPQPVRRVVGNLDNVDYLLRGLSLPEIEL
jgi:circadian clock protein KaiB